ncbi:MAG: endo-1,4-beta-xylanase [Bacteroidales bacterium]|nr:endo-1,4-beta-xylanase [Bacteroidales bacterium]
MKGQGVEGELKSTAVLQMRLLTAPLADGQEKFLGCAHSTSQQTNFAKYWNQVTPENGGKWGSVEATKDVMNWTALDAAYNLAKNNNYPIKTHTLIWGSQQPYWIETLDTMNQRLQIEQWFDTTAKRYPDIDYIDVVNEPLHAPPTGTGHGNYINALGGNGVTGWDWVIRSFRMARHYFPNAKLLINEYGIVNSTVNTNKYIQIINLLKAESLIDGIGVQAHAFNTYGIAASTIKANLDLLAATGLPVYVSELDIDGPTDLTQLHEYQRVFPVFWEHTAVAGVTLWGFRYGLWRNDQKAYLVTQTGVERPAFQWLKAYVNDTLTLTQSVTITAERDTIFADETLQLRAQVLPANTTIKTVTWSLLTSGVATISTSGLLTPVTAGKVTIRAVAWDGSNRVDAHEIYIVNRPVTQVNLSAVGDKDTIMQNETLQLNSEVLPANATNRTIAWSIIPDDLATISAGGLLSPADTGLVTIIASATDGSGVADTLYLYIEQTPTPVAENAVEAGITVYPNPAPGGHFTLDGLRNINKIEFIDLYGRIVAVYNHIDGEQMRITLPVPRGLYLIRFHSNGQVYLQQLLVD